MSAALKSRGKGRNEAKKTAGAALCFVLCCLLFLCSFRERFNAGGPTHPLHFVVQSIPRPTNRFAHFVNPAAIGLLRFQTMNSLFSFRPLRAAARRLTNPCPTFQRPRISKRLGHILNITSTLTTEHTHIHRENARTHTGQACICTAPAPSLHQTRNSLCGSSSRW